MMRRFLSLFVLVALVSSTAARSSCHHRYPNELPGFKFYRRYFSSLRPFVSDRAHVARVFGADDKIQLKGWTLWATYIGAGSTIGGHPWAHNVVGLLDSIDVYPRRRVSMAGVNFPRTFKRGFGGVSEINVSCDIYSDRHGLQYWLYSEDSAHSKRGDLMKIVYGASDCLEREIVGPP